VGKAEVCFDQLRPSPRGLVRTTGIRLAAAAARDLRMLEEFIVETQRTLVSEIDEFRARRRRSSWTEVKAA
jgi:hypothetical protein